MLPSFDSPLWLSAPVFAIPAIILIYMRLLKGRLQYQNNSEGNRPHGNKQKISIDSQIYIFRWQQKFKVYLEQRRSDNSKKAPSDRAVESVARATWVIAFRNYPPPFPAR
jgi:heme/copper-type cytochrome/quinol oxidase subunit 2